MTYAPLLAERPVVLTDGPALYVQKYEASVAEWNACHAAGACTQQLRVAGNRTPEELPATGLSYVDVGEYLAWINATTGHDCRLTSLMEWEHIAAMSFLERDPARGGCAVGVPPAHLKMRLVTDTKL